MAWNWRPQGKSQADVVNILKSCKIITSPRVEQAMLAVDRRHYCPNDPYLDSPQKIGFGATISAPHMHAYALKFLEDKLCEGAKVLDVGSGSGYLTMCMAHMVGETGLVVGIEHIGELLEMSVNNIKNDKPEFLEHNRVKLVVGDGRLGFPDEAPYDAIHVGAAATGMPEELCNQLKPGGKMVIPIGVKGQEQTFELITKQNDDSLVRQTLMSVFFVPLTGKEAQWPGSK